MPPAMRVGEGARPPAVVGATVWTGVEWRGSQDVTLEDGRIAEVRPHHAGTAGVDAQGAYLVPGWVNGHTHLLQSRFRGIADGLALHEWIGRLGDRTDHLTPGHAYLATIAAALENLRSGTTTIFEHTWPGASRDTLEAVIRALTDVGIRAHVGIGVADRVDQTRRWGADPRFQRAVGAAVSDAEFVSALGDTRLTPALAIANPRSVTASGMREAREYSERTGGIVSMHLSETPLDDAMYREHTGRGVFEFLADTGFLWPRVLLAHCVAVDADDIAILAASGARVVWNPVANMRLGSGVAPITRMIQAGVPIMLGTDGAASNDRQDMMETMRLGAYAQRATLRRADLLRFPVMAELAAGGRGWSEQTGVAAGAPADLTILRFERDFATLPVGEPGAALLTTGSPSIVDTVLVNGEIVLADGHSTRIDESALIDALSHD